MTTKSKGKSRPITAFWDTSALVPLCCFQPQSAQAGQVARTYTRQIVWWGTVIEAVSSLYRLTREGTLNPKQSSQAFARLDYLRGRWNEVQPTEEVRDRAERLLRIHRLRAADALQLAAALVWCGDHPQGRTMIGADGNLSDAADAEGFLVIRLAWSVQLNSWNEPTHRSPAIAFALLRIAVIFLMYEYSLEYELNA
jgi:uncharacterized protein